MKKIDRYFSLAVCCMFLGVVSVLAQDTVIPGHINGQPLLPATTPQPLLVPAPAAGDAVKMGGARMSQEGAGVSSDTAKSLEKKTPQGNQNTTSSVNAVSNIAMPTANKVMPDNRISSGTATLSSNISTTSVSGVMPERHAETPKETKVIPVIPENSLVTTANKPKVTKKEEQANEQDMENADAQDKQAHGNLDKFCKRAKKYYRNGDIDGAERMIQKSLKTYPGNGFALAFEKKLAKLRERMQCARTNMANEYYFSAESLYRKGFVLDAMLEIKRSLALVPKSKEALILRDLISKSIENIIARINENDRDNFRSALDSFFGQDYIAAEKILRSMQNDIPEASNYMPTVIAHIADAMNESRSDEYLSDAQEETRTGRFVKAQHDSYLALEMNRHNFNARLLLEKLDLELSEN
jgi:hypothetical protein